MSEESRRDNLTAQAALLEAEGSSAVAKSGNLSKVDSFSVGAIDLGMLSAEEIAAVECSAKEIDISDVDQIVRYGSDAQKSIAEFSSSVLEKVRVHDLEGVGESLRDLTVALDETVKPEKKGILGLFGKAKKSIETIRAEYSKVESNVDRIEKDLRSHEAVLVRDIAMFQEMYERNAQHYKDLTLCIFAGRMALDEARAGKLSELRLAAECSGKQEDVQVYSDFDDLCHRFEKKLSDLEITRVIAVQSAPQIRMLQNNDREMLDKLQSSIANTIPLWRNQLVLSLGIEHAKRALDAQKALTDKTNELLLKNSETLRMASVETAKAVERPIVDLETLEKCNENLIASISEVASAQKEGEAKRMQARERLAQIETQLKQAVFDSAR